MGFRVVFSCLYNVRRSTPVGMAAQYDFVVLCVRAATLVGRPTHSHGAAYRSTVFARWRLRARPSNTRAYPTHHPRRHLIGSAVFARPMPHSPSTLHCPVVPHYYAKICLCSLSQWGMVWKWAVPISVKICVRVLPPAVCILVHLRATLGFHVKGLNAVTWSRGEGWGEGACEGQVSLPRYSHHFTTRWRSEVMRPH